MRRQNKEKHPWQLDGVKAECESRVVLVGTLARHLVAGDSDGNYHSGKEQTSFTIGIRQRACLKRWLVFTASKSTLWPHILPPHSHNFARSEFSVGRYVFSPFKNVWQSTVFSMSSNGISYRACASSGFSMVEVWKLHHLCWNIHPPCHPIITPTTSQLRILWDLDNDWTFMAV